MVRMRCGMGVTDALTLWKWRESFVVEWTLLLENRMDSLFRVCVACLIVTSCDVELIDEFVCEKKWCADSILLSWSLAITWVLERNHANLHFLVIFPIHSESILHHQHRLSLESHNCNHHHSFPFSSYLIQSIASFPSTQLILIHHSDPSSIESTYPQFCFFLFTIQWSILMQNPTPKFNHSTLEYGLQMRFNWKQDPSLFNNYSR